GLDMLFSALESLNFDWFMSLAGSGEESYVQHLKTKAENLKLSDRIKWLGQISDEDKFELLAKHNLLVLPSHNE
ncbi:glycosyltransferase, partial [Enterobacter hormaechei]|nr:glycosyltransferase [Enterobacter hormaechei]